MSFGFRQAFQAHVDGKLTEHEYITQLCSHLMQALLRDNLNLLGSDDDLFALSLQSLIQSPDFRPIRGEQGDIIPWLGMRLVLT